MGEAGSPRGRRHTLGVGPCHVIRLGQVLNEATARVQLLVLVHGVVPWLPVVQHEAAVEALDLVDHARVVEACSGQAPLRDGHPGGEGGVGGHAVQLAGKVVLHLLLAVTSQMG